MKKLKALLFLSLILLGGCNPFKTGDVVVFKNGEIAYLEDINFEDAFINVNYQRIDEMIKAKETFLFYLKSEHCAACQEFKPIILDYVKESQNLIYIMDEYEQKDDINQLIKNYSGMFFPFGEISTPQVYLFDTTHACQRINNTRYETKMMFINAMNQYVKEANIYSVTTIDTLNKFIEKNNELNVYLYDRNSEEYVSFYNNHVKDEFLESNNKSILFDLEGKSDEDKNRLKEILNIEEITPSIIKIDNISL